MNKKILIYAVLSVLLLNCKGKSNGHEPGTHESQSSPQIAGENVTKLVRAGDLHIAFDFMSMPYHIQMMKLMKVDMKHSEGATHGLMVTVMDYETKKILKDAGVSLTVTAPDGKITRHETEIIQGAGMHHYAIHLKAEEHGKYLISAQIKYKGKNFTAKTEFSNP